MRKVFKLYHKSHSHPSPKRSNKDKENTNTEERQQRKVKGLYTNRAADEKTGNSWEIDRFQCRARPQLSQGCTLHSCLGFVCNKANTDKSEGDKLKEGRASEATRQRWRMMVVYGCRASCLSLPVICRERGACVPFLFWQSRLHFFHRKNTLKCLHLYCLLTFTAVRRIHL